MDRAQVGFPDRGSRVLCDRTVGQGLGGVCPCGKPAGFIAVHTALLVRSVWAHAVRLDSNLPPETSKLPYFVRFGAPLTRSRFHPFLSL